jgi:hypothetical protein
MGVCVDDNWKMVNLLLGSWVKVVRSGFLLRWCRAGVLELEFDGVFVVLPLSDSFNGNGFVFGKLLWRSAKLLISDGAVVSLAEEVICPLFPGWPLRWCQWRLTGVGFCSYGFLYSGL